MKNNNNKLRIGVIGTGYLGKFHAEKYAGMDDVELIGVVDINKSQVREIAEKYNTKAYGNHLDIIDKVDAVSIAAPTPLHHSISKNFLENNIDVLIEKPITTTIEEADELIRIAESRKLIIQVGHLERFNPAVIALKDIVKKPLFIESHRLSPYKERAANVSVVLDLMIHDIDIITKFVNSRIKNLHAAGTPVISKMVDIANARFEFENGCVANVTSSRLSTKDERKIRLFQEDAYITVDFANREVTIIKKGEGKKDSLLPGLNVSKKSFPGVDALDDELKSFVKSVRKRHNPVVNGQVGRDALSIAMNIMDQIEKTNNRIKS